MKTIAVLLKFSESDKARIESIVKDKYNICYFSSEEEMIKSDVKDDIEIIFGEPHAEGANLCPNLKFIQMTWAGVNLYTGNNKLRQGIRVSNASGCFGRIISEYILGGLLSLYRKFYDYRELVKNDGWKRLSGEDTLYGKRVLILGTGDIGKNTAERFKSFGSYVVGIKRILSENVAPFDEIYTVDNLDAELAKADVVVITLPGTKETYKMFDKARIGRIKKGADFINIGRGFIVDMDALTEAVQTGHIRYCVLDVTDPEPLPDGHPLRNLDNVLFTPHISGISWDESMNTKNPMLDIFCSNLELIVGEGIDCGKLVNEVDLQLGY